MLSITLCKWYFLKRNKAYTILNDFVIPITCLKFNQVPPKSKTSPITPNGKGCQRVASNRKSCQKVANSLWLRLPTIQWIVIIASVSIFVSVVQYTWFSLFLCFSVPNTHSPHNQELSNFALKTKLSFAVRCGHFRRKVFQPFLLLLLLLFLSSGLENPEAEQFMYSNRYALVCEWIKIFSRSGTILVYYTAIFSEWLWRPSAQLSAVPAFLNLVTNVSLSTGHTRINSLSVLSW